MTREQFKNQLDGVVDGIIDTDRELTEDDENNLIDHFGDVAQEILQQEDDEVEGEGDEAV
jgi:hypothetical protein